jgi:hypothetical protein
MRTSDKAKPAPAAAGKPVSKIEQLSGRLDNLITSSPVDLQVARLTRLYAVNASMAEAIAPLVFLEALR